MNEEQTIPVCPSQPFDVGDEAADGSSSSVQVFYVGLFEQNVDHVFNSSFTYEFAANHNPLIVVTP